MPQGLKTNVVQKHSLHNKTEVPQPSVRHLLMASMTYIGNYYYNSGIKLYENGYFDEAARNFRQAISLCPQNVDAYYNLGLTLLAQKKFRESVVYFKKTIDNGDRSADNYYFMGIALQEIEEFSKALYCYDKAIIISPGHLRSHLRSASIYTSQKENNKAIFHLEQALEITPDNLNLLFSIADLHKKDSSTALKYYRQIITLDPGNAKAHRKIGEILHGQGFIKEAIQSFDKALAIAPDPGLEVRSALALPVINNSWTEINCYRQRLENKLDRLSKRNLTLKDPLTEVGYTSFLLAYHNLNDRCLQQKIAAFYLKACPALAWPAPRSKTTQTSNGKIKIGFISTFLYSHTIAYLFFGIIEQLSKKDFHSVVFRFPGNQDPMSAAIDNAADEVVKLPYELDGARKIIADSSLDILFYLDIGMEPITYFLAFARLAPVQCKRGHPVTSGIPNLDYFISCNQSETREAKQHYSEQLIRLETYGYYYYPPKPPSPLKKKSGFGLPIDSTLYVCPQSLFKFHPDFDFVFGEILRKDLNGTLILIEGREKNWSKLLLKRFTRTFPGEISRVIVLDKMSNPEFLSLCMLADAILDTPGFTGGKISLDCFALGLPIITIASKFMRGRLTFAQYNLMGIDDCIAKNDDDFIKLALKLAHDKTWKTEVSQRIRQRSHILFKNSASVKELELFFKRSVKREQ